MKKVKLFEQFLNEETSFPAQFEIGEPVSFITAPGDDQRWGSIVKVSFTKAKVFYDILDDYTSTVIGNIDSVFVKTLRSNIKLEEPTNESVNVKYFEQYLNEVTQHSVSGNSGRTYTTLDNSKYELKKDVKDAKIGDYVDVILPKGTIITNLPGGVFANHKDLKDKYCTGYKAAKWHDKFGVAIRTMPDTLEAIENNSKILESKYDGNIAGDAAEYIAKELSHYVKGIIDQSNDKQTYFHLKDKSYKNKVIKTLKDIYGLDAQDGGTQFSPSPTIKFDNDVILEAIVNEAKDATREEIMDLMETKYKIRFVRTSEEFDGEKDGIWIAGDNGEELSGNKIFDYYNKSAKYKNGVLKNVVDAIEKKGWWFSWNDPGTMMIWPKN